MTLAISCSKPTIEPLDCRINYTIRFLDKDTGEDIISRDASGISFWEALEFINYVKFGEAIAVNGKEKTAQKTYKEGFTYLFFSSSALDICVQRTYLNVTEDKYIISYTEGLQPDSIIVRLEKINAEFLISYYLNDSLVETINTTKGYDTDLKLPVIDIRK